MREKEFYSKLCVAASLFFVVNESKIRVKDINLTENDKLSRNIATILAKHKEVVAVKLIVLAKKCIILISKNSRWYEEDNTYIRKIEQYLKNIAEHPFQGKALESRDVRAFHADVMRFCYSKFQTRFEKLKKDIIANPRNEYISGFVRFASIDIKNIDNKEHDLFLLSLNCYMFYKSIIRVDNIPKVFLKHLKKMGSCYGSLKDIVYYARNEEYKKLFSNMKLIKLDPILDDNYIFSWSNIIKQFVPEYKDFKKACLKDSVIASRLRDIYGVNEDEDKILLDFEDVKQSVCLHAEMNIVADIIKNNNRRKIFIAVSKRCCYLCELYIKFANDNGFNIIIPAGKHKKIYHSWKLPNIKGNSDFNEKSVSYLIEKLDQVIMAEIDSRERSKQRNFKSNNSDVDYNSDEDYKKFYFESVDKYIQKSS